MNTNDVEIKVVDFSTLEAGKNFFFSRQEALIGTHQFKKIDAIKNDKGVWHNAINPTKANVYIVNDSRVWVRK